MVIDGTLHECDKNTARYNGSALTTIGSFGNGDSVNNLVLDHLIISSGVIVPDDYMRSNKDRQLCYARLSDRSLP